MIRRLIWKFFPPIEVRQTMTHVDQFLAGSAPFSGHLVERDCRLALKRAERVVRLVRIEGKKPEEIALRLIRNSLGNHLCSGEFHSYRGLLDQTGQEMLSLSRKTVHAMLSAGYCTEIDAEAHMLYITEGIKNMG